MDVEQFFKFSIFVCQFSECVKYPAKGVRISAEKQEIYTFYKNFNKIFYFIIISTN